MVDQQDVLLANAFQGCIAGGEHGRSKRIDKTGSHS